MNNIRGKMILEKFYMGRYTISYLAQEEHYYDNRVIVYMVILDVTTRKKKKFHLYSFRES